jgi:hypothetical protein
MLNRNLTHRSIMLASKFFDDVYYNNAYYARVGGISNVEVRHGFLPCAQRLFALEDASDRHCGTMGWSACVWRGEDIHAACVGIFCRR